MAEAEVDRGDREEWSDGVGVGVQVIPPPPSSSSLIEEGSGSEQGYSSDSGRGDSTGEIEGGRGSSKSNNNGSEENNEEESINNTNEQENKGEEVYWDIEKWQQMYSATYGFIPHLVYDAELGKTYPDQPMIYEFQIPQAAVGKLIGKHGNFVNKIRGNTGAAIIVKQHHISQTMRICAVEGFGSQIDQAIAMIKERFPQKSYPQVKVEQMVMADNGGMLAPAISFLPTSNRLSLIECVVNDVSLSCVVSLEHIFVQQPTHPTFPALAKLHLDLKELYDGALAPKLIQPFGAGIVCVAQIQNQWYRTEVVAVDDEKEQVTARLVDVGGYFQLSFDSLRQIRGDFVSLPFQATECRLANVLPVNEEEGWSEEAINFFKILCQGQVLQTNVVGYSARDYVTLVHMWKLTESHEHIFINQEMVTHGYAKWIDDPESPTTASAIDELSNKFEELEAESASASPNPEEEMQHVNASWADISSSSDE